MDKTPDRTTIRLNSDERKYARELSLRCGFKCPRGKKGSVAHGLKALLHLQAKREKKVLSGSAYFI